MKQKSFRVRIWFLQTAFLSACILFALCPVSCKVTDEGLQLLRGDYTAPVLESYAAKSERHVTLSFSERVTITGAVISRSADFSSGQTLSEQGKISPILKAASGESGGIPVSVSYDDGGRSVIAESSQVLEAGTHYELYGEARDENGNSLTFYVPFVGFNGRMPKIVISGIHPQFASASGGGDAKCEFVELYALTGGNAAGLTLQSAADGKDRAFTLPAAEIKSGETVIVHLRTKGEGCVSETGSDLSLSSGWYTSSEIRDIWAPNEKACLGDKEDVLMLVNSFTGDVLDAVLYAPADGAAWSSETVKAAAREAVAKGFWKSDLPSDVASSADLTASKMLKRSGCIALGRELENGTLGGIASHAKENWRVEKIVKGAVNPAE